MNTLVDGIVSDHATHGMLPLLIRVTLVLTLAWLAHAALRRSNPRFRIFLWRAVAFSLLVVIAVGQLSVRFSLPLLPASRQASDDVQATDSQVALAAADDMSVVSSIDDELNSTPRAMAPEAAQPTTNELNDAKSAAAIQASAAEMSPQVSGASAELLGERHTMPAIVESASNWGTSLLRLAIVVWFAGICLAVASWLAGILRLVSLHRRAEAVSPQIQELAKRITDTLGYRGRIDIRQTDAIHSPSTVGAWQPRILIPRSTCEPAHDDELIASLVHELAHCQGNDLRWNHLLTVFSALFWFHPLAWRIRLAHADACDVLCDATASDYLGDRELYSRILAALALRVCGRDRASALAMARRSGICGRIDAVRRSISTTRLTRGRVGVAAALALAAALGIGTVTISRSGAQVPATQDASKPNDGLVDLPIQVTAKQSGEPLLDVEIRFNGRIGGERFDATVTTNEEGVAILERPDATDVQNLWMTAKKSGFVPVHYTWLSDAKKIVLPEHLDLELPTGQQIDGRVVDEAGKPIVGADVQLSLPVTWPGLANYVFTPAQLKTDEDGRWSWDGAPVDLAAVGIRVTHPDFMRGLSRVSGTSGNLVTLKSGLSVEGQVVDAQGRPVVNATAQLGFDRFGTDEPKAETDEQGHFVIRKCKPGQSAVTIQAEGYCPQVKRIKVSKTTEPVSFTLAPGNLLSGRVVDLHGKPIAGVLVAPDTWQGYRTLENRMTTDEEGRFVWDGAPAEGVEYSILKEGYMARRDFVLTAAPEEQVVTLYPKLEISGRVTDATTGEPVKEFAIQNGYQFANSDQTYWSRDEAVPYTDGKYSYEFDEPMRGRLLQVVAAGYQPATSRIFKSDEGKVEFDFQLQPGKGPTGLVVLPDGSPAVGAEVGLASREKRAFLDEGYFDRNQNHAEVVTTDEEGRFAFLPQDDDEFVLIVFHDAGFAILAGEELADVEKIVLVPWGKLRGRVLLGDQPDVGRRVSYYPKRPPTEGYGSYIFSYGYETKTDEEGRFEFDRVITGPGTVSRVVVTDFGRSSQHSPCWQTPVDVQSNQTTEAQIGGTGRPVTGRVVLDRQPDVAVDWTTNEPATIVQWDAETKRWAKPYTRYAAQVSSTGEFTIPDVPAGDYQLNLPVNNPPTPNACGAGTAIGAAELVFSVPQMPGGRSDEPMDVGTVTAKLYDTLDVGERVPDFVAERLDGGTLRLADFRGQLVVLDFWATWCGPCLAEMPTFERLQEKFGDNPRFALISLSCDNSAAPAREYVKDNSLSWNQAHVAGTEAQAPKDFTVRSLPATFLIAPDGTVLAKNLRGEELERAVAASLVDDELFSKTVPTGPDRFPVVRFEAAESVADAVTPAVVVLDNVDPTYDKETPHYDGLRAFDAHGKELWSRAGLNNSRTVAGVHGVAVDSERGRIYVRENVTGRITAFDVTGQKLWQIDNVPVGTLAVDQRTGNLWCSGGPRLDSGETVVFDTSGKEVAAFPYPAVDIVYDPHTDVFWLVGCEVIKLARDGSVLFREPVAGWCCPSASVNPTDGSIWIIERAHPDVTHSENRLWLRKADGSVVQKIDLGDDDVFVVECDPTTGDALFSGHNRSLRRATVSGELQEFCDVTARNIAISPTSGDIWAANDEKVLLLDKSGHTVTEIPFSAKSRQSWIAAF